LVKHKHTNLLSAPKKIVVWAYWVDVYAGAQKTLCLK